MAPKRRYSKQYDAAERQLIAGFLDKHIAHAERTVERMKAHVANDPFGSVGGTVQYWEHAASAFKWARSRLYPAGGSPKKR